MKYVKQFGIIAAISFVSEILHALLPLPVPASIYGLLLLFALLALRVISVSAIRETGYFLIMPLMFISTTTFIMKAPNTSATSSPRQRSASPSRCTSSSSF